MDTERKTMSKVTTVPIQDNFTEHLVDVYDIRCDDDLVIPTSKLNNKKYSPLTLTFYGDTKQVTVFNITGQVVSTDHIELSLHNLETYITLLITQPIQGMTHATLTICGIEHGIAKYEPMCIDHASLIRYIKLTGDICDK